MPTRVCGRWRPLAPASRAERHETLREIAPYVDTVDRSALSLYRYPVSALDVDKLVLAIAERFTRYEMREHLKLLRAYYVERRRRKRAAAKLPRQPWDEDMVLQWAALWRIPPFEQVYQQLKPGERCPCGRENRDNTHTEASFPEGVVWCCRACDTRWLVVHGGAKKE